MAEPYDLSMLANTGYGTGSNFSGNWNDFLTMNKITPEQYSLLDPATQKGINDSFIKLGGIGEGGTINTSTGLIPGLTNMEALQGGLGLGQLGLGVLSYLDQSKTAGKQRKLLDQQINQNKFLIDQAKQRQKDIAKTFSGGLAARSAL